MAEPTASIQVIVFGERNRTDFPGVLKDVATAGFPAFENGNLFQAHGEEETRRLLKENNLRVSGAHFGYGDYTDEAKLAANIACCKALGIKHMMCSGVGDAKTVKGYQEASKVFNQVGRRLRDEGLQFNYHNHWWEFDKLEGGDKHGMNILDAETDPAEVKYNIDVFWVTMGGENPAEFIRQHADRAGYFHFKDGRRKPEGGFEFLELGRGVTDLKGAMEAAREVGAEWVVYEQDSTQLPQLEAITISRNFMRDVLGV